MGEDRAGREVIMSFPDGWWSFELGRGVRPGSGTYDLYPVGALPPLDPSLGPDFAWLAARSGPAAKGLGELQARCEALGLSLPEAFVRFFSNRGYGDAVPSCTACEWDLTTRPVASPVDAGAWIIRFYRDQQDCLFWSLYLHAGRASVICSPIPFGEVEEPAEVVLANTWEVAPDFVAFVARWWIENNLWDLLEGRSELSPIEAAYADHCRQQVWFADEE